MSRVLIKIKGGVLTEVISDDPGLYAWLRDYDDEEAGGAKGPHSVPVSAVRTQRFAEHLEGGE